MKAVPCYFEMPMPGARAIRIPALSKLYRALAQLALHAPKGRITMSMALVKLASFRGITPSVYGPLLQSRWHDLTFRFCASGYYGRYLSEFLSRRVEPFSFIDIGANIGLYTLIAARNANCHRCYAFEPNPEIYGALTENVRLNGHTNVEAINAAVSETAGVLRFAASGDHSGAGSLIVPEGAATITVTSVNKDIFDRIAAEDTRRKIVKIDVEGHEPIVIAELMKSEIWSQIDYVFFECDEARYDVAAVIGKLEQGGLRQIYRNGSGKPYDLMFARTQGG